MLLQSDVATCFKRKIHPPLGGETVRTGLQTGQALNLFQLTVLNSGQMTTFFYLQAELQKELLELKGHEEAAREQDIMRKKVPKKPASHPLTIRSFILSSISAWCSLICQTRHSKEHQSATQESWERELTWFVTKSTQPSLTLRSTLVALYFLETISCSSFSRCSWVVFLTSM